MILLQCVAPFDLGSELLKGLVTLIFTFIGAAVGLLALQALRARWIGCWVGLEPAQHTGWSTLRVHNGSAFSMRDAYVYITLRHSRKDVENLKDVRGDLKSYINKDNPVHLYEDRICWAIREKKDGELVNKMAMDIHPHERQNATFIDCGADTNNFIGIVSENATQSYRIFLKRQGKEPYRVLIKVVSADSYQATWEASIDINNSKWPVNIISKKLSIRDYQSRLDEYREYYNTSD